MSDEDSQMMGATAQAIAGDLELADDGGASLPDEASERWSKELEVYPPDKRQAVCTDLLALSLGLHRVGSDATEPAVARLMELCAILLVSGAAAKALFEGAGLEVQRQAASVTGAEVSNRPATGERVEGAVSPLGARFAGIGGPGKKD